VSYQVPDGSLPADLRGLRKHLRAEGWLLWLGEEWQVCLSTSLGPTLHLPSLTSQEVLMPHFGSDREKAGSAGNSEIEGAIGLSV
jgi:hypothetical protein